MEIMGNKVLGSTSSIKNSIILNENVNFINNKHNIHENTSSFNSFQNFNSVHKYKIELWNSNSINSKFIEFKNHIIEDIDPDIVSLNETKISNFAQNRSYTIQNTTL